MLGQFESNKISVRSGRISKFRAFFAEEKSGFFEEGFFRSTSLRVEMGLVREIDVRCVPSFFCRADERMRDSPSTCRSAGRSNSMTREGFRVPNEVPLHCQRDSLNQGKVIQSPPSLNIRISIRGAAYEEGDTQRQKRAAAACNGFDPALKSARTKS